MQFKTEEIISGLQGTKVVNDATELTQDFDTIVTLGTRFLLLLR